MEQYTGLVRLTNPEFCLTDTEMQNHMRFTCDDTQMGELRSKMRYAQEYIEDLTQRAARSTQYRVTFNRWPNMVGQPVDLAAFAIGVVRFPRSPLISVDSITYVDVDGVTQTLAVDQYQVTTDMEPGYVGPARMKFWPAIDPYSYQAIKITFTAGYATNAAVPEKYKEAIKFIGAYRFMNRESDAAGELPKSFKQVVEGLKVNWLS